MLAVYNVGSGLVCTNVPSNVANLRWRQPVANAILWKLMVRLVYNSSLAV